MSEPHRQSIPVANPVAGYLERRAEIDAAIQRVLESGRYVLGPEVEQLESSFAAWTGAHEAIATANGTDAIELSLRGAGIGADDLVFAPAHTAGATIAAIERAGARPVLVDIGAEGFTIDPESLDHSAQVLNRGRGNRPAAVIVVHLYGAPADMPALMAVAARHNLIVIEDCAQAHGASVAGRAVGTWGSAGAFSFYPTKNLGALGDGGAVITNDSGVAQRVRLMREYGWRIRQVSDVPGFNSRLDELQAAVLSVRLRHLATDNARRRHIALQYEAGLQATRLTVPHTPHCRKDVHHLYVIATPERDDLRHHLARRQISTAVHYPLPIHKQPAYAGRLCSVSPLEHAEAAARTVVSLPMYPQMADADVAAVIEAVAEWDRT